MSGLRAALVAIRDEQQKSTTCSGCMYPQHHSGDESGQAFANRLQDLARAALEAEPSVTGYLPGMNVGTGGNVLPPAEVTQQLRTPTLTDCGKDDCTPVEHWQRLALAFQRERADLLAQIERRELTERGNWPEWLTPEMAKGWIKAVDRFEAVLAAIRAAAPVEP